MVSLLVFGPSIFFFVFRGDQDMRSTFTGWLQEECQWVHQLLHLFHHHWGSPAPVLGQCVCHGHTQVKPVSLQSNNPYVFIVATHKDQLGPSADQKILQLNGYLKSLIEESGFEKLVQYADRAKGQVMFAVDNTSESDDEDFKAIRSKVHNLIISRKEFTVKYPDQLTFSSAWSCRVTSVVS